MSVTQLKTQALADSAVTTPKIGDGQITQPKLASGVGGNTDHSFRLRRSTNQSLANGTFTNINWDIEQFDTDDLHSLSVNTDKVTITAATAGKWLFAVNGIWGGGSSGQKIVRILKNGGAIAEEAGPNSGGNAHVQNLSVIIDVVGGDTIYVDAYQDSGATQNFGNASIGEVWFSGIRIAT